MRFMALKSSVSTVGAAALGALLAVTAQSAAEEFSGKTAAYIDWAVKNCSCKSTDQEHKLVEQANATDKAHDSFQKAYLLQFQSKELSEVPAGERALQDKCDGLKGLFGPSGSRIAGLITWDKAPASASSSSSSAAAASRTKRGRRQAP